MGYACIFCYNQNVQNGDVSCPRLKSEDSLKIKDGENCLFLELVLGDTSTSSSVVVLLDFRRPTETATAVVMHLVRLQIPRLRFYVTVLFSSIFILLFYVYGCIACVCLCTVYMQCPQRPEEGLRQELEL